MRKNVFNFVITSDNLFSLKGPVLEIGSLRIPSQLDMPLFKDVFEGRDYIGCDMLHGIGVDRVENAENLSFPEGHFKTVLILDVLEHVEKLEKVLEEAQRVLSKDGILIITSVFDYKIHNSPSDYWRFTPESFRYILRNFPKKIIGYQGPDRKPQTIFGIGFKKNKGIDASSILRLEKVISESPVDQSLSFKDKIYLLKQSIFEILSEHGSRRSKFELYEESGSQ